MRLSVAIGLFTLFASLIMAGCKRNSSANVGAGTKVFHHQFHRTDSAEAQQVLLNAAKVECDAADGNCPSVVGGLVIAHPVERVWSAKEEAYMQEYRASYCSTTRLNKTQVLTNLHCVPKNLRVMGADCSQSIRILFPKTKKHPEENLVCDQIESFSTETKFDTFDRVDPDTPDWAILSLKNAPDRGDAAFSFSGTGDDVPVQLWPVRWQFAPDQATGSIRPVTCQTTFAHSPQALHSRSFAMAFHNCSEDLIMGNSGTGVFLNNSLVGVLNKVFTFCDPAATDSKNCESPRKTIATPLGYIDLVKNHGGGTHLHCIPPLHSNGPPPSCKEGSPTVRQQRENLWLLRRLFGTQRYKNVLHSLSQLQLRKQPGVWAQKSSPFLNQLPVQDHALSLAPMDAKESSPLLTAAIEIAIKKMFPVTPLCVPQSGRPYFSVPYVAPGIFSNVSYRSGVIESPLKVSSVHFKVVELSSDQALLTVNLEDEPMMEEIHSALKERLNENQECLTAFTETLVFDQQVCGKATTLNQRQQNWKQTFPERKIEFENAEFLALLGLTSLEVELPICGPLSQSPSPEGKTEPNTKKHPIGSRK